MNKKIIFMTANKDFSHVNVQAVIKAMPLALVLGKYPTSYLWAMSTIALLLVPPLQPFPTCYICSTTNIFFVYNLFFTFCGSVIWAHLIRMATEWDLWRMLYRPSYNAAVCPITLLPFIVKIRKKPLYLDFPLSLSRQQLALIWDVDNVSQSDTWLSTLHCFAPSVFSSSFDLPSKSSAF